MWMMIRVCDEEYGRNCKVIWKERSEKMKVGV
jgi:hypothetical protein